MKVLIVGAGIGGTTAAIALARRGVDVRLFERAPELRPLGAGLSLWSNAIACLSELGLRERLLQHGTVITAGEIRTPRGAQLGRMSFDELRQRLGHPSICIQRGRLQETLVSALPEGVLHLGCELAEFSQDSGGVTVRFQDGRTETGDVLVGADGLRSLVRARIVGDGAPRFAGYGGWLGVAPFHHETLPEGLAVETWGRGSRFGMLHCGHGHVYWFAVRNSRVAIDGVQPGLKQDVVEAFRDWHPPIGALIEATDESRILRLSFFDRDPIDRWGEGRVTLLGDAAHPMTPNIGQGGCQAIEDALVLAECLHSAAAPADGLREYERRRMPRTSKLVKRSRRLGQFAQSESRLVAGFRNLMVRMIPPRAHVRQIARQLVR